MKELNLLKIQKLALVAIFIQAVFCAISPTANADTLEDKAKAKIEHSAFEKGKDFYKDKKYKQAIEQFELALKKNSKNANAHLFLAHSLYSIGNSKEAISHYDWLLSSSASKRLKDLAKSSKRSILSKSAWRACPQKCLKLSTRGWKNKVVQGKPKYLIWMDYPHPNGAIECWSQDHLGELIKIQNGLPRNYGLCPTCKGKLYVGNPVKFLKKSQRIPFHPRTVSKRNKSVFGKPWSKNIVNDRYNNVYYWYTKGLPKWGWAIVDKGQVPGAYLIVITNGTRSKWIKIASSNPGRTEVIMMGRRTK